jgi:hypothetical protein
LHPLGHETDEGFSSQEEKQEGKAYFTMDLDELLRVSPQLYMNLRTKCELECVNAQDLTKRRKNVVHIPKLE